MCIRDSDYYREACNEGFRASIWMALGDAYCGLPEEGPDRHHLARNCFERAWSLFERDGDGARCELATAQGRLGDVQVALAAGGDGGSLEMAIRHFRNALAIFVDLDEPDQCGRYHARLADAYIRLSDMQAEHLRKGIRAYGRALEMFEQDPRLFAPAVGTVVSIFVHDGRKFVKCNCNPSIPNSLHLHELLDANGVTSRFTTLA